MTNTAGHSESDRPALVVDSVTKAWDETRVLDQVTVTVNRGEWLGVIGPNGAGKSTLLQVIASLTSYDGRVALADQRQPAPTDIALVPQNPVLPPGMTVGEYVLLGRTAHLGWLMRESAADRAEVAAVLERLDLVRFASRFVESLSGGEAQRVLVARALAQQAPIILLDEPTSALDIGHQTIVLELLDGLRKADGITVIAAMHDLTSAARYADRLLVLHEGRAIADGAPRDVLTEDVLASVYATPLRVRQIDNEIVVLPAAAQVPEQ